MRFCKGVIFSHTL